MRAFAIAFLLLFLGSILGSHRMNHPPLSPRKFVGRGYTFVPETIEDKESRTKFLENREIEALDQKIGAVKNENDELKVKIELQKQTLEQNNTAISNFKKVQRDAEEKLAALHNLNKEVKKLQKKLQTLSSENANLKNNAEVSSSLISSWTRSLKEKTEMIEDLKSSIEEAKLLLFNDASSKDLITDGIKQLKQKHEKELEDVNAKLYESRIDFQELSLQSSLRTASQVIELQSQMDELNSTVSSLRASLSAKDEELTKLRREVKDFKTIHEFISDEKS